MNDAGGKASTEVAARPAEQDLIMAKNHSSHHCLAPEMKASFSIQIPGGSSGCLSSPCTEKRPLKGKPEEARLIKSGKEKMEGD